MLAAHQTVMKDEAVKALVLNPSGHFVDCTYGRGGHTEAILRLLRPDGRLLVIDQDLAAIEDARQKHGTDERVMIVHGSFADLATFVDSLSLRPLDGVLLDLGVSSPQIDEAERGFSFDRDGPLDMRMDQSNGETAGEWLMRAEERDITHVLFRYGEEKFARRIARAIVEQRESEPLTTTRQLVRIIEEAIPRREKHKHPATRSFQAIRIFINRELDALESCLASVIDLLGVGGRLVVISFHSLEDRIVKRFMRDLARGEQLPDRLPIRDDEIVRRLRLVGKPVRPAETEVASNRRARSSIMRIAEKR
ncbi:MAG: 16S rRNA (cytosine(1402)-N(4))-methyltransferase RsmH [Pseudomonadota bacterium]